MKVHPLPNERPNFSSSTHKNLKRLPHIFARVLELPFNSDTDVSIQESPDCFRFAAVINEVDEFEAHVIEIHPGVTKIVVRPIGFLQVSNLDDLELDMWRFRLPESTRPDMVSAVSEDGELVVTVPKALVRHCSIGNFSDINQASLTPLSI